MKSAPIEFLAALDEVYRAAPCEVLPNALWKTRRTLRREPIECLVEAESGSAKRLVAHSDSVLSIFWTRDRAEPVPDALLENVGLALLHEDYASAALRRRFAGGERYFRLSHWGGAVPDLILPPGFKPAPVVLPSEAPVAADLIGRCYRDLKPSASMVESWTSHPTFASDLWVWILDTSTGKPAALGIAELDARIGEGSLEWVQVLPAYRGRSLGRALVSELLRRLVDRTVFVSVSGQVDNVSHPEALYRHCGFQGEDIWWVLRR